LVSSEIRDTVMISIAAVLLASLLGFVSFLMVLRSDIASVRNSEVYSTNAMANFREFNAYTGVTLYGEDVVAAVRDYYDSDIKIAVKNASGTIVYSIDKNKARQTPSLVDLTYLQGQFSTSNKYTAVLVYGNADLTTVTLAQASNSMDTNVTGIVFFYVGVR
jgi:hypothetical protein